MVKHDHICVLLLVDFSSIIMKLCAFNFRCPTDYYPMGMGVALPVTSVKTILQPAGPGTNCMQAKSTHSGPFTPIICVPG